MPGGAPRTMSIVSYGTRSTCARCSATSIVPSTSPRRASTPSRSRYARARSSESPFTLRIVSEVESRPAPDVVRRVRAGARPEGIGSRPDPESRVPARGRPVAEAGSAGREGFPVESASGAVAALVLLAAPAPAGVVAADVAVLVDDRLLRRGLRCERRGGAASGPGRRDRLRTRCDVVLVGERLRLLDGLELVGVLAREFDVEERQHRLLADRTAEQLEHQVALAAVLDERGLPGH